MNIPENHLMPPPNAGIGKFFRSLQSMNIELDNIVLYFFENNELGQARRA